MKQRWRATEAVSDISYYFAWCTKYRRKLLDLDIRNRMDNLLRSAALQLNAKIEELDLFPDHVVMCITAHPVLAPHQIVQHLKRETYRALTAEFPSLKSRVPSLWTRPYYVSTQRIKPEEAINRFIDSQKNR